MNESFDETKGIIIEIAQVIKDLPESIQARSFDLLFATINTGSEKKQISKNKAGSKSIKKPSSESSKPKKETGSQKNRFNF